MEETYPQTKVMQTSVKTHYYSILLNKCIFKIKQYTCKTFSAMSVRLNMTLVQVEIPAPSDWNNLPIAHSNLLLPFHSFKSCLLHTLSQPAPASNSFNHSWGIAMIILEIWWWLSFIVHVHICRVQMYPNKPVSWFGWGHNYNSQWTPSYCSVPLLCLYSSFFSLWPFEVTFCSFVIKGKLTRTHLLPCRVPCKHHSWTTRTSR